MKLLATLLLALLAPLPALAADTVDGFAFTIGGDTIEIHEQRIRPWDIDAPEIAQRCIEAAGHTRAALTLRRLFGNGSDAGWSAAFGATPTDMAAWWRSAGRMASTLANGWCSRGRLSPFRKYSLDYAADEDRASAGKVGLWAGEFQNPSAYRHQLRPRTVEARDWRRACTCPDDTDRGGRRSDRRSAHARPGSADQAGVAR